MSKFRLVPYTLGEIAVLPSSIMSDITDWGLHATGIPSMWPHTEGEGVLVGICDTGRPNHIDLEGAIKCSKRFISATVDDKVGHSTHVSGIIAADRNGHGVIGVAPKAKLCIAKTIADDSTGSAASTVKGIDYCIEQGCDIISLSLASENNPKIRQAILRAVDQGILVVCAAGNTGKHATDSVTWPAKMEEVIAVGSCNELGKISDFSARGPGLDFVFPGEDILSCWLNDNYRRSSGTSMATPFCSAVLALLLSYQRRKNIDLVSTKEKAIATLKVYTRDTGEQGRDADSGWGIVDLSNFSSGL